MTVRELLFRGFTGCTNFGCVIQEVKGVGTNGQCHCIDKLSRRQLQMLSGRISVINNIEIPE
jgi:hypothetical protein